jgi:hypothetical protein
MSIKIAECRPQCKHNYQDKVYDGKRVFNQTRMNDGKTYRCSVCGDEKGFNLSKEEEKKAVKKK